VYISPKECQLPRSLQKHVKDHKMQDNLTLRTIYKHQDCPITNAISLTRSQASRII